MVLAHWKDLKKARNRHILNFLTNKLDDRERRQMNLTDHVKVPMSFCRLKTKLKLFGLVLRVAIYVVLILLEWWQLEIKRFPNLI